MSQRTRGLVIMLIIALLVSCHRSVHTPVSTVNDTTDADYLNWADPCVAGYHCTFMYREEIKQAIDVVNLITNSLDTNRLAVAIWGNDLEVVKTAVPVYVVEAANNPPCEVPFGKRVVIIDERFPRQLSQLFVRGGLIESTYLVSPTDLLTVLLLHELGHISHRDYQKDVAYRWGTTLNDEKTTMKDIEQQADEFAVTTLRDALRDTQNTQRALAARHLIGTLGLAQLNLGYIRQKNTKQVSTDALSYYLDNGYTHPNTELRLLVILHETTMDFGSSITDFESVKARLKALLPDSIRSR